MKFVLLRLYLVASVIAGFAVAVVAGVVAGTIAFDMQKPGYLSAPYSKEDKARAMKAFGQAGADGIYEQSIQERVGYSILLGTSRDEAVARGKEWVAFDSVAEGKAIAGSVAAGVGAFGFTAFLCLLVFRVGLWIGTGSGHLATAAARLSGGG